MRERYVRFCENLTREVAAADGVLTPEAMVEAVQGTFNGPGKCYSGELPQAKTMALAKAKQLLKRGDIQERLSTIFEASGFDVVEAAELHVRHMRGEIDRQVHIGGGEFVTVKKEPSLSALLAYEKMTMPQPASKVAATVVHLSGEGGPPADLPPMVPRALNATVQRES
jgi:hypothetical protein